MPFWSRLFGHGSNEYVYLREAFANHHHSIEEDLNKNHPHAVGSLARYGVDLKKLRKRAATVVTAAAVAGVLLTHPFGVHAPTINKTQETEHTLLTASVNSENSGAGLVGKSSAPAPNSQVANPPETSKDKPGDEDSDKDGEEKGHRGHTRGRSYLAPPKEHGLHDLGEHKGDKNAPHPIKDHAEGDGNKGDSV